MTKVNHNDEHPRRPYLLTLDRGSDFIGQKLHEMCENDFDKSVGHLRTESTSKCSRGTCSLNNKKFHSEFQTPRKSLYPFINQNDPWSDILAATTFAVRSIFHTALRAMPGQLVSEEICF